MQRHRELRAGLGEVFDHLWQHAHARRGHGCHPQASGAQVADVLRRVLEAVEADIGAFHLMKKRLPLLRRDQPHACALEQGQPGAQFQLGYQPADVGLRGVQHFCRGGHGAQAHDAAECFDLPEVHPDLPYQI
ncbi:hypothetical protein D3C87_1309990 [compost metagenome]